MLTTLDVVNAQLATMGLSPILEADIATHPLANTGILRLRMQNRLFQTRGWWFNTIRGFTAEPGAAPDYEIEFPCGVLRVEGPGSTGLSIRGNALYDWRAEELRSTPISGVTVVVELAFEDLPPVPQTHVYNLAVLSFQQDFDTTQSRTERLKDEVRDSFIEVNAQHTREIRANRILFPETLLAIAEQRQGRTYGLPVR